MYIYIDFYLTVYPNIVNHLGNDQLFGLVKKILKKYFNYPILPYNTYDEYKFNTLFLDLSDWRTGLNFEAEINI